ncbi:glycosyltransferase [Psychrobacter sp. P11G3]|uniref:CgeB family protein n=1 Tax=Psychrobacter sp. P11G3 TaxID=1699623 RepID=UPI00071036BA|nr:glycosyltransferase [Psychrobacter sp. P11G3]
MKKLKKLFKSYAKTSWTNLLTIKHNIDANKLGVFNHNVKIENHSLKATHSEKHPHDILTNKEDAKLKVDNQSNGEYSQHSKSIQRSKFGMLVHEGALELEPFEKNIICYELIVKSGQLLVIKVASRYLNMKGIIDRKAVLTITSYDERGKEIDIPCGKMVKSENLRVYFKYIPSTNNNVQELHSFVVPDGVSYIQLGLSAFNTVEEQQVLVTSLSVKPKTAVYQSDSFQELSNKEEKIQTSVAPLITRIDKAQSMANKSNNDKKSNNEQDSKKNSAIEQVEFGMLIHGGAIELTQESPLWYELPVKAGQLLVIKVASQYLNMKDIISRKAVLLINSYDEAGKEVDVACGRMVRSEALKAYFKYIPSTHNHIKELHTFVVPDGVSQIRLGLKAFNIETGQQVFVESFNIEPKVQDYQNDTYNDLSVIKKETKPHSSIEKSNEARLSQEVTDIKKSQLGMLIHRDAIQLTQESPLWYELPVKAGQLLVIKVASQYSNMKEIIDRKAVLLINSYDEYGQKVDVACGKMAKSEALKAYFKYLPSTNDNIIELHTFIVPDGVSQIHLGLSAFNIVAEQQIFVKNLSIETKSNNSQATKFLTPSIQAAEISMLGWPEIPINDKPCIIGIMDEFTTGCFEQDVNLIQPRPDNWFALAEKYKPVLFFIESAWQGNYGSWQYRVGKYANKPGHEIDHICQYARDKGIPTLFWNKEDPVHHEKFMCSAKLVDHIYTTDANMKTSYTAKTGNVNVHPLPFAAQPALHKPAVLSGRKPRACFAGSWYGNRHAERGQAMSWLLKAAHNYGLDIYDRNYDNGTFPFPEEYQAGIKGSLPYKELCEEYNRYRIFLNVNSVTDSPTMFSRRVFELMASGTPIVSTYAKGIEALFDSDAVWLVNSQEEADVAIQTLMTDDVEWRRRSLAGIREVFSKHTYAHRLNSIFSDMNLESHIEVDPNTVLFAKANNLIEMNLLKEFAKNQSYQKFFLIIEYAQSEIMIEEKLAENIILINPDASKAWTINNQDSYSIAGWITPHNYYGEHYLRDLINASIYEPNAKGWAKALGEDIFGYGAPALLSGSLWKKDEFISIYIDLHADDTITVTKLYLADSEEFKENTSLEYHQLRGIE